MKSAKSKSSPPASPDRTIIIVKDGDGFEFRVWNRYLGDAPIGARLSRKDGLPNLPTKTATFQSALDIQNRWQSWLDAQPNHGRRKGKR